MQTIVSEGRSRVKKGGSTNDYAGLPINISILILMLMSKSIKFGGFFRKKVWLLIIVPESLLSQTWTTSRDIPIT